MSDQSEKLTKTSSAAKDDTLATKTHKGMSLQDNRIKSVIQKKANSTGLPDNLKSGIENLSGHSMDDVKVHYNSNKPAQLNAHAYAQGTDIHVASGQEKHLAHEAWHVVQQKQGRVKPTVQMKEKVNVNDDKGLEKEADIMGAKALSINKSEKNEQLKQLKTSGKVAQLGRTGNEKDETGVDKIVLKLNLPGSGDDLWRSRKAEKSGKRIDNPKDENEPTQWRNFSSKKITWTIAGPGGPSTKGGGENYKGTRDIGSNSIGNNKELVPQYALNQIKKYQVAKGENAKPILLLIKAHSRNAVAATQIALSLQKLFIDDKNVHIELVAFDPVPGPLHDGPDTSINISSIPQSTLIYSVASQHLAGFTPQKVLGAKRIIISKQNHGGGLIAGYTYAGKVFKGSNLNSLPNGVYVDSNGTGENKLELLKIDDLDNALHNLKFEFESSAEYSGDTGRMDIIREVLTYYYTHNAPPPKPKITHEPSYDSGGSEKKSDETYGSGSVRKRNTKKDETL